MFQDFSRKIVTAENAEKYSKLNIVATALDILYSKRYIFFAMSFDHVLDGRIMEAALKKALDFFPEYAAR